MASFILVHGSWHGAWCWDAIVARLQDHGHEVKAIDLPAHGDDRTPAFRVSLGAYSRRIQAATEEIGQKPLLVGHSMGGIAISQAAVDAPHRFAALVHVCAFVPLHGESLMRLGRRDTASRVPASLRFGLAGPHMRRDRAKDVFYNECSDAAARWATEQLRPDPWRPLFRGLSGPVPPDIPRGYVECTKDQAISIERQRAMTARIPFETIATLETDHSPFLSTPDELARELHRMSRLIT